MLPGVDIAAELGLRRPLQFVGGYGGLDHVAGAGSVSHLDLSGPNLGTSSVAWAQNVGPYVVVGSPEGRLLRVIDPTTGMFTDVPVGEDAWWLAGSLLASGNQRRDLRQLIQPAVAAFNRAQRLLDEGVSRQDAYDEALAGGTTFDWSGVLTSAAGRQFLRGAMTAADAARYFNSAMRQRQQRVGELLAVKYLSGSTPLTATPATVPAGVSSLDVAIASTLFSPESPGASAIAASVGGGVVVKSVRYEDATHVVLNLDTTRARAGTYDVTITNPNGKKIRGPRLLQVTPPTGELRVTTSPTVTSQVIVDGTPRDSGGVNDLDLAAGRHEVTFTHEPGFVDPAPQTVTVIPGSVTQVVGTFVRAGSIRVGTSPTVPAAISVDGIPRDEGSLSTDLSVGSHRVCFGPTPGFTPPGCQTVSVVAGSTTSVTGRYSSSPGAPGPSGTGQLRVTTNPALPSQVVVNGVPMDSGGLNGVDLPSGAYTVTFTHVEGFTAPPPQTVTVSPGAVTLVTGNFTERGSLRVIMSPEVPATVTVDEVAHDSWGMSTDVAPGLHTVCFGWAPKLVAPQCQTVTVVAGGSTTITGTYTPGP
jgi:hypothetical protein